ncbi:hypothetical protein J6590_052184 [Homalodisca vitripennis]|nr:hypothetical protein J6590_052184 [Homalodisca vitripennis]
MRSTTAGLSQFYRRLVSREFFLVTSVISQTVVVTGEQVSSTWHRKIDNNTLAPVITRDSWARNRLARNISRCPARLKDNARYMCNSVAIYQLRGNRLDILSVLVPIHYERRRCEGLTRRNLARRKTLSR